MHPWRHPESDPQPPIHSRLSAQTGSDRHWKNSPPHSDDRHSINSPTSGGPSPEQSSGQESGDSSPEHSPSPHDGPGSDLQSSGHVTTSRASQTPFPQLSVAEHSPQSASQEAQVSSSSHWPSPHRLASPQPSASLSRVPRHAPSVQTSSREQASPSSHGAPSSRAL